MVGPPTSAQGMLEQEQVYRQLLVLGSHEQALLPYWQTQSGVPLGIHGRQSVRDMHLYGLPANCLSSDMIFRSSSHSNTAHNDHEPTFTS